MAVDCPWLTTRGRACLFDALHDAVSCGAHHLVFPIAFGYERSDHRAQECPLPPQEQRDPGLFVASVSSPGSERSLLESARDKLPNDWSRDGKYLSFQENDPQTGWNLWALSLDGSHEPFLVLETPFDERGANFSPDGQWIAYHSNQSGRYEVYVLRVIRAPFIKQ
jgi:hypothetical protein